MKGNELFKDLRVKAGFSVRAFASAADLDARSVSYYESGKFETGNIPARKALSVFRLLSYDPEQFMGEIYSFREEIDAAVLTFKKEHPVNLSYEYQKRRVYNRLSQLRSRKTLPEDEIASLFSRYRECFLSNLPSFGGTISADGMISEEAYQRFVVSLCADIKAALNPCDIPHCKAVVSAFYHTDFSMQDASSILGITRHRLTEIFSGEDELYRTRILTACRMCRLFSVSFHDVFD